MRPFARRLYLFSFLNDFILLYPVYALLFTRHGLTVDQVAALFVIWSVTSIVAEVPSGALADTVSRRALVAAGPLLAALGYALWGLFPSFNAFAAGFVLWGLGSAMRSGAFEALIYDELTRLRAAGEYPRVMGRIHAVQAVAILVATAVAAPVLWLFDYGWLTAASVAAGVAAGVVAGGLPGKAAGDQPSQENTTRYRAMLTDAAKQVRRDRRVRHAVILVVVITAVWGSLEEFVPLLATDTTGLTWLVPVLILTVSAGQAVGGMAAHRLSGAPATTGPLLLAVAAVAMTAGALVRHPAGFGLIAVAFGAFQALSVVTDAHLQAVIDGPARATVTSMAGLGIDVAGIGVYAAYGVTAVAAGHPATFAQFGALYLLVALLWWVPGRSRVTVPG